MKKLLKGLMAIALVFSSMFVATACGKDDDKNDELLKSLSWLESSKDLKEVFADAYLKENYTLTAKQIIDFSMEDVDDGYGTINQKPVNVVYSSDVMYKIYLENDAVYFDAGDKKDTDGNHLSTASELIYDRTDDLLVQQIYTKTETDWVSQEAISGQYNFQTGKTEVYGMKEKNDEFIANYIGEIMFAGAFNKVNNVVNLANNGEAFNETVASFYDSDSQSYKINSILDYVYRSYNKSYDGVANDKIFSSLLKKYIYLVEDENGNGYEMTRLDNFSFTNIQFKLDGQNLTYLSYDVYDGQTEDAYGLHVEIENIGNSEVDINSNVQPVINEINVVEATPEMLESTKTFYNQGNYTATYKTDFYYTRSFANSESAVYNQVLKVTQTAVSYYMEYYNAELEQVEKKYQIITKHDDTNLAYYTYDYSAERWFKSISGVAEDSDADTELAAYKTYYWNLYGEISGNKLDVSSSGLNDNLSFSHTLNSYIIDGGTTDISYTKGDSKLKFTEAIDGVYTFGSEGLKYCISRHKVNYSPDSDRAQLYAEGLLTKIISDIGSTEVEIPLVD